MAKPDAAMGVSDVVIAAAVAVAPVAAKTPATTGIPTSCSSVENIFALALERDSEPDSGLEPAIVPPLT
jgi:hypothetical protein